MIRNEDNRRPRHIYPVEPWRLVEKEYSPDYLSSMETLFTVANGYIGIRGSFEENAPVEHKGTYVNAFYESWPIAYGENAFGFARTGQTIVPVPDATIIKLYVDDEPFKLKDADLASYERALNMKSGTLDREILWETSAGKKVLIKTQRLVSFEYRHLVAMSYEVTVLNSDAPLLISSKLECQHQTAGREGDPRKSRSFAGNVLIPKSHGNRDNRITFGYQTKTSGMTLGAGIDHVITTNCAYQKEVHTTSDSGKLVLKIDAKKKQSFKIIKYVSYHTSNSAPTNEMCDRVNRTLDRSVIDGYPKLLKLQQKFMDDFWEKSDVVVTGNDLIQQTIRFNLYHICQATARAENVGVPAKGLTGDGYEGHYFWDTEIYIVPFLVYTSPRVARNLIRFRYSYLDKARERAEQVNQKGALFPWRTINGDEASSYYAAGTAQYHINADIIYAMRKYVQVTGDKKLLEDIGAEMLIETARLWYDLGFFSDRKDGQFVIHGVTGPDEYNTVVNNNTYTNLMARENLWYAAEILSDLARDKPALFASLVHKTKLDPFEIENWKEAADAMYVPFDEKTGINPQDDAFLDREIWDFKNVPKDKYPLLLHFHPLVIYRHQVIKQADIVMAMFLLGDEFTQKQKRKNFEYYDPLTTGDSSLSACIQSVLAFEVGDKDKAIEYARKAALMDLEDLAGNVKDGCHVASMGGFWMSLIYGFAGMRDYDGNISFEPRHDALIDGLNFSLLIRGQSLEVKMDFKRDQMTYKLKKGKKLTIRHYDRPITLLLGKAQTCPIEYADSKPVKISKPTKTRKPHKKNPSKIKSK